MRQWRWPEGLATVGSREECYNSKILSSYLQNTDIAEHDERLIILFSTKIIQLDYITVFLKYLRLKEGDVL
jgi:hypothetical protein